MAKLQVWDLTFIAEKLGRRAPPALKYLTILSRHPSDVVREGVVYGLAPHREKPEASMVLHQIMTADPSALVRDIAREALEP